MTALKRDVVKYVRDKAKARYRKADCCEICGSTEDLDLHHFLSLTSLVRRWMQKNGYSSEDIVEVRDQFIKEHEAELYEYVATLCRFHHQKLHSVYGKNPGLGTAKKQARWIGIQRDKNELD